MPRNMRSTSNRKDNLNDDRSRPNEGVKMHGSRSNESDRELRLGTNRDDQGQSRRSTSRTRHTPRGH